VGDHLAEQEHFEEAIKQYEQAIDLDSRNAEGHVRLGDAYLAIGHEQQALKAYRRALKVAPRNASSYLGLSDFLVYRGRFKAARVALKQAIDCEPNRAYYHYRLAWLYFNLGKTDLAQKSPTTASITTSSVRFTSTRAIGPRPLLSMALRYDVVLATISTICGWPAPTSASSCTTRRWLCLSALCRLIRTILLITICWANTWSLWARLIIAKQEDWTFTTAIVSGEFSSAVAAYPWRPAL